MKTVFLCAAMSITLVKFDTQDNIHQKAFGVPCNEWTQTLDLDTWKPAVDFGLRREDVGVRFTSVEPVSTIRLNNFPYHYKVKKISKHEFLIKCGKWDAWFDDTDMLEVIVKYN